MKKILFLLCSLFIIQSTYGQVRETKYWTFKKTSTKAESPSIPTKLFNDEFPINYIVSTFSSVGHVFHYMSDNDQYMFFPGLAFYPHYNSNKPGSIDVIEPSPALIFKKTNGVWVFWKETPELKTWMIRNHKIKNGLVVIGDGNEIGSGSWKGNSFLGKIGSEGKIDWVKVNDEKNMAYFHGITMGDLNGDGLMDVGGSPAFFPNPYSLKTFIQNKSGSFTNQDHIVEYNKEYNPPFTLEYEDLNGDGVDEIITADYGSYPPNRIHLMNNVMVYTLNKSTGKFENTFVSKEPTAFYNLNMGATSIKVHDFTGDGILDLSIARESQNSDGLQVVSFEIWKGKGDRTFAPHWSSPILTEKELLFREFIVYDLNKDSHLDIILRPHGFGSYYRNNPVLNNFSLNNGIKLNKVIWLNDGKGKFNHYDKDELKIEAINIDNVHPYIDSGNLHFMGTHIDRNKLVWNREVKSVELETYDIQVHLNGIDAPKKPDLTFPQKDYSGLTGGTEFKWSSTENARKYQIQFSTVATFTTLYLESDTLTQPSFKMPAFKPGDPVGYYWRVRGIGVGGNGEWSSIHNFTRAALTSDENVALPNKFELYQNYPNPFNPSTQIQFSLPSSSPVKIEVYNSVGQRVKVLVDETMSSGTHSITFDASALSSGVYLYRLTTPEFTQTRVMSLVK